MVITVLSLALGLQQAALVCPAMPNNAVSGKGAEVFDYQGVRYSTCCAGCEAAFKKDPAASLKAIVASGKSSGVSLFDPITGSKIAAKDSKFSEDYKGIRYYFTSEEEKKTFDASPKKYTTVPAKEALYCPVYKVELKAYDKAEGYVDFKGVRYYVCCGHCMGEMKKDASKWVDNATSYVKASDAIDVKDDSSGN